MISLLCAMVLAQTAPAPQVAGPFPKPVDEQPAPEFLNWSGFGYLPAGDRTVPTPFAVPGDWSSVEANSMRPGNQIQIPWHLKVFVLRRVDLVEKLRDGTLYEEKCAIESNDMARIKRSLKQLAALVQVETNNRVGLSVDVSEEPDPVLPGGATLQDKIASYVYSRFNGGSYQADDKVYRGPYASVICLHPVPTPEEYRYTINGTTVTAVSAFRNRYEADGLFTVALAEVWREQVQVLAKASGVQGALKGPPPYDSSTGLSSPLLYVPKEDWNAALQGADLDATEIDSRLRLPVIMPPDLAPISKLFLGAYKGADTDIRFDKDPEHGDVLTYSERGSARTGGVALPVPASGRPAFQPAAGSTLSFWVRSASRDPLGLWLYGPKAAAMVSLGRDLPGPGAIREANFQRDGQWHQVKLDLAELDLPSVTTVVLAPTENSLFHAKVTLGPVEYSFADFKVDSTAVDPDLAPIVPAPDSADDWARAIWAHSQTQTSAKLAVLLKDPQWFVRLNALHVYAAHPDPSAEALLKDNATTAIDGPVAAEALEALWALGPDVATAIVSQVVQTGVTEQGKAEAADLLTRSKDPAVAEKLIALNQSRTLETRLAAVRYLGRLPGDGPAEIRMSFLLQADQELKLEVTRTLDADQPTQLRELKISAVDEPSDAVRAESDEALIRSKDPANRAEGYKGIKDDSLGVRLILLDYFAQHPDEFHRNAIRIAVTDRSARVRAAAIRAFAALPKEVTWDEVGAAAHDRHPVVELALVELCRTKGLKLSTEMSSQMRSSPDERVRAAVQSLG